MRLSELEPSLKKIVVKVEIWDIRNEDGSTGTKTGDRYYFHQVDKIEEADGIWFLCPKCFKENNGSIGTHSVACWRPRIPQNDHLTGPGRWELVGTSFDDLSLVANPTSVKIEGGCNAHFTVSKGEIIWNA
jgi:hypothetical protein